MKHINKLRLLTDNERNFIESFKKTKKEFKNPATLRIRLKEKAKNLILSIPELIRDVDLLYIFSIEEGMTDEYDVDDLTFDEMNQLTNLMPISWVSGKMDLIFFLKDADVRQMLLFAVSNLFINNPDEYKKESEQIYKNMESFHIDTFIQKRCTQSQE